MKHLQDQLNGNRLKYWNREKPEYRVSDCATTKKSLSAFLRDFNTVDHPL